MQDADDSDAAPRDMFLNKMKQNKGIAAPLCTRAAALPFLLLTAWRAGPPPETAVNDMTHRKEEKP